MNWILPRLLEFGVPFLVKVVLPEGTFLWISLMVSLAIETFERVRTWFALFGF